MNEAKVREILRRHICEELLKRPDYPLRDDEPLITGGLLDSFLLVQLAVFIEENLGVYIPDTDLNIEVMNTLAAMTSRTVSEQP